MHAILVLPGANLPPRGSGFPSVRISGTMQAQCWMGSLTAGLCMARDGRLSSAAGSARSSSSCCCIRAGCLGARVCFVVALRAHCRASEVARNSGFVAKP